MTFSKLSKGTIPHRNKYSNRNGRDITRVIAHHWAGTAGGDTHLAKPGVKASTNYLVYSDGTIKGQVPEELRAWTSGSFEADAGSITVEIQNSKAGGQWPISDKAYDAFVNLVADIAKRYGWGAVSSRSLIGHRDVYNTECPGPYVYSRLGDMRAAANKILNGGSTPTPAVPDTPPVGKKSVPQLVEEVLQGLHGNGDERKRSLGAQYAAVQAEVNRRLGVGSSLPTRDQRSVAQLADEVIAGAHGNGDARKKSLGSRYTEVQAEVNRRLGGSKPRTKSIAQLANEVLRGAHGNGDARKKSLGPRYAAVQAEVNRRLGV